MNLIVTPEKNYVFAEIIQCGEPTTYPGNMWVLDYDIMGQGANSLLMWIFGQKENDVVQVYDISDEVVHVRIAAESGKTFCLGTEGAIKAILNDALKASN